MLFILYFLLQGGTSSAQCTSPVSAFPYNEDFESSNGGWTSGGIADDWAWGTPAKPVISNAASGLKCWITGGTGNSFYNAGERSFVQSPCFDFSAVGLPVIMFKIFWETEKLYDGGNFQYSINGGSSWSTVGRESDPSDCINNNWYNHQGIINLSSFANPNDGWSGNIQPTSGNCLGGLGSNGWVTAIHAMPFLAGKPQVLFRFTFGSGTTCNNYDGFAFDQITILDKPPLPIPAVQSTPAGCTIPDGTITLNVTGGAAPLTYSWMPNVGSGLTATGLAAGTYMITVQDSFGCSVNLQAVVPASPPVVVTVASLPDTCGKQKGMAMASGSGGTVPYQFAWNTGSTVPVPVNLASGSYTVTVTDSKGCTASAETIIADTGYFRIDLGPDREQCGQEQVILNPGNFSACLWQDGSNQAFFTAGQPGTYSVLVTDASGCTASDSINITSNCLQDVLFPSAFTPNDDGFNDVFFGYGAGITSFHLEIFNRWGGLVFLSDRLPDGWNGMTRGHPVAEGTYIWKVVFRSGNQKPKDKTGRLLLIR